MDRRMLAYELVEIAKRLTAEDAKAMVKSAVKSLIPKVTVGITPQNKVIIFMSRDYDNKGKVTGPFEDVTKIGGKDGFYMLSTVYDDASLDELGYDKKDVKKLLSRAKRFASKHKASHDSSLKGSNRISAKGKWSQVKNKERPTMNREAVARELVKVAKELVADADLAEIARAFKPKEVWKEFKSKYISKYQPHRWEGLNASIRGDTLALEYIDMDEVQAAVYAKFKKPRVDRQIIEYLLDVKVTGDSNTYRWAEELGEMLSYTIMARYNNSDNVIRLDDEEELPIPVDDGNPTKTARFLEKRMAELLDLMIEQTLRDYY